MDGIVILSESQLADFDKTFKKKERKSKKKLHHKERKKNKKRESKQHKRSRKDYSSSSSCSESEHRNKRRTRSSSASSTSSSSSGVEHDFSLNRTQQEKDEEELKRAKLAEEINQRREAAGLGWMTRSATLPQGANQSTATSSNSKGLVELNKHGTTSTVDGSLEFDTLAKPKQTAQSEEQDKRDPLSMKNPMFPKHLIVALGDYTMLMLPPASTSLLTIDDDVKPVWIVPLSHALSIRDADGPILEEVDKFKMSLVNMFRSQNKITVFMEQSSARFNQRTKLECVGMDTEFAESLPIIFGKEISECDQEWTENEKLLDLKTKTLRQGLPPKTPYFFVEIYDVFPNQGPVIRYGHIIESDSHFPSNFGWNVIRGILGKEMMKQSKSKMTSTAASGLSSSSMIERNRLLEMLESYKKFDWTAELEGGEHQV